MLVNNSFALAPSPRLRTTPNYIYIYIRTYRTFRSDFFFSSCFFFSTLSFSLTILNCFRSIDLVSSFKQTVISLLCFFSSPYQTKSNHSKKQQIPTFHHHHHQFKMLTSFVCGSFNHQEQDMDQWSPPSTPRRSSKKNMGCKTKDSKNPYADRGLDKFTALLADLDNRRQKIYTQNGAEEISFVRFVYTEPNDCKPIIVKVKDNKKQDKAALDVSKAHTSKVQHKSSVREVGESKIESNEKTRKWMSFKWNMKSVDWRRPSYYLPVFVIFILLFLAIFGRSFAILCTSIGWYLVPTINGGVSATMNSKRSKKKKEYLRRSSDVKVASSEGISSPESVITRMNDVCSRQHSHKKSW